MNDIIKNFKQELIAEIMRVYELEYPTASGDMDKFYHDVINIIHSTETMKHGKWTPVEPDSRGCTLRFACSVCDNCVTCYEDAHGCDYDYCPNCGAKMDLEE